MGASATYGLSLPTALRLGRVSNLPTVWTDVLAGTVLSGAALSPGLVAAAMLALSLFYVAGMFLNDAFDAEHDRARQPHRPIPSGAASEATVFGVGAALMLVGLGLVTAIGLSSGAGGLGGFAWGVALMAAIVVYNRWHKNNPAGPVLMGLCRALVYAVAAAVAAPRWAGAVLPACLLAFSYLIGLTYAAKQEHLAKPGSLWPLLFLLAPFVALLPVALTSATGAVLYLALALTVGVALWLMLRTRRRAVGRAVGLLIAGICLLDGLLVVGGGQPGLAAMGGLGFGLTLLAQRWVPGT